MISTRVVPKAAAILFVITLAAPAHSLANAEVVAQQSTAQLLPFPDRADLDVREIRSLHGLPDLAFDELMLYERVFAELPTRVGFHLANDRLFAITLTFAAAGRDPADLRHDADRVLKRLGVLYGTPVSITGIRGRYKSHVWDSDAGTLEHTVVYTAGIERHAIEIRLERRP